jgi:hypothetical protein
VIHAVSYLFPAEVQFLNCLAKEQDGDAQVKLIEKNPATLTK